MEEPERMTDLMGERCLQVAPSEIASQIDLTCNGSDGCRSAPVPLIPSLDHDPARLWGSWRRSSLPSCQLEPSSSQCRDYGARYRLESCRCRGREPFGAFDLHVDRRILHESKVGVERPVHRSTHELAIEGQIEPASGIRSTVVAPNRVSRVTYPGADTVRRVPLTVAVKPATGAPVTVFVTVPVKVGAAGGAGGGGAGGVGLGAGVVEGAAEGLVGVPPPHPTAMNPASKRSQRTRLRVICAAGTENAASTLTLNTRRRNTRMLPLPES
jgi:hypothetical protein